MLDNITLDDFVTYIIMFWFVAMPVLLVWSLWWNLSNQKRIRYIKAHAPSKEEYLNNSIYLGEKINGIIKIIQAHTSAIANLEGHLHLTKIPNVLSKPPKSLKDKVLAASKRNGKRGKTS